MRRGATINARGGFEMVRPRSSAPQKRSERAARKAAHDKLLAAKQEAVDEAIAPAVQRLGTGTKNPRLLRDGITFRVANPIEVMVRKGKQRERNGGEPTINERHAAAVRHLAIAWEVSQTITAGVSGYGDKIGGMSQSGYLSDAALRMVRRQTEAAELVAETRLAMGTLWGIVEAVGFNGQDVKAWGVSKGIEEKVARGYLRAALDVLIAYQAARSDRLRRENDRHRSIHEASSDLGHG